MEYLVVYNDGSMPKQIYGNSGTATGGIYMYVGDKFFGYPICGLRFRNYDKLNFHPLDMKMPIYIPKTSGM